MPVHYGPLGSWLVRLHATRHDTRLHKGPTQHTEYLIFCAPSTLTFYLTFYISLHYSPLVYTLSVYTLHATLPITLYLRSTQNTWYFVLPAHGLLNMQNTLYSVLPAAGRPSIRSLPILYLYNICLCRLPLLLQSANLNPTSLCVAFATTCTILYYTILYYTILHYTTLYYTILYHSIL